MKAEKLLKKFLLSPGYYNVNNAKGERRVEYLSEDRLKSWADKITRMNDKGLLITAPYEHNFDHKPVKGEDRSKFAKTRDNGGFWTKAEYDEETKEFNVYVDPATNKDREAISKRIKGVSIYTEPKYTDPFGEEWEDVPLHIALTNSPMFPQPKDKRDFVEEEEAGMAIAMSDFIIADVPDSNIGELRKMLEDIAKIALPEGTNASNIFEFLMAALQQKKLSESEGSQVDLTKAPNGAVSNPTPILMSESTDMTDEQKQELESLKATNEKLAKENSDLQSVLLGQKKSNLTQRCEALVMSAVIEEEYATGELIPQINDIDSYTSTTPVEASINALEKAKKPQAKVVTANGSADAQVVMSNNPPANATINDNPLDGDGQLSPEHYDKLAETLVSQNVGNYQLR